jgi:hypothetical protein
MHSNEFCQFKAMFSNQKLLKFSISGSSEERGLFQKFRNNNGEARYIVLAWRLRI